MSCTHVLRKALTITVVTAICLAGTAMAKTLYVDASVATTGDGSLAAPFKTISEGITAAAGGDQVLIAGGIYYDEPADKPLKSDLTISGSYDSTFTVANVADNPTIIDMARLGPQEQDRTFGCQGVTSFVIENLVIENSSTGEWGNTDNGGAIYIRGGSQGTIRGVSFVNCRTQFEGGVMTGPAREGGAVCIRDASTVTFEDCVFDSCTAVGGGGAVRIRSAGSGNNVKFYRCLFTNCGARGNGSAIDDGDAVSQLEIVNCIFANNGVDVAIPAGTAPSTYLIRVADRRALIYNCTFVGNNTPAGYMFNVADSSNASATKEIVNCIIANNTIVSGGTTFAIFNFATGYNDATKLQNNLFFSNSGLDPLGPGGTTILGADGNMSGEPQFEDAAGGDYHLKAGSPGVDAGQTLALVPNDFTGTTRPVGAAYDIGALEGQAPQEPSSYPVPNVVATATSSLNADSVAAKTVDESGLNDMDQHDTKVADMWTSAAGQQPPVQIQYEFDAVYWLAEMWVWNSNSDLEFLLGWGVKTATIEYSTDGVAWTALANVPEFARAPGAADYTHDTTVDFGGVAAKFVRITCTSSWGGGAQYGLSEVRFFYVPVSARGPKPPDGAAGVSIDTTLSWKPGRKAASHEVHLGTDMQAVAGSAAPVATVSEPQYAPTNLQLDTTYYWKVIEVNQATSPGTWDGPVWSFSTLPYVPVDDFEGYTDISPKRVFQTWIDGIGYTEPAPGNPGNGTGSTVGYDPAAGPIMERRIVHGGRQAMPLAYDGLSETTRTFEPAQDWTRGGIKTLVLFFQGTAANTPAELYVKINGTKLSYTGSTADLASTEWKQCNIDLPASVGSVRTLTIGVSAGQGTLYIDDIRLYHSAPAVNP